MIHKLDASAYINRAQVALENARRDGLNAAGVLRKPLFRQRT